MDYKILSYDNYYHLKFQGKTFESMTRFIKAISALPCSQYNEGGYFIFQEHYALFLYHYLKKEKYPLMKLKPYDYQEEAIAFCLANKSALLRMCCGAGKTTVVIGSFVEAKRLGLIKGPGLIVVKASLKHQWVSEIKKFSSERAKMIQGEKTLCASEIGKIKRLQNKKTHTKEQKERLKALLEEKEEKFLAQFQDADLFVLNYETLNQSDISSKLLQMNIDFIAADECHYIKNPTAKRSLALYQFNEATIKIGATATPIQKNLYDIYGIYHFIKPELFSSLQAFEKRYVTYYNSGGFGKISGYKNVPELMDLIKPYLFTKTDQDIASQLPELVPPIQLWCNLDPTVEKAVLVISEELEILKEAERELVSRFRNEYEYRNSKERIEIEGHILMLQTFSQELANAPELLELSDSPAAKMYAIKGPYTNPKLDLLVERVGVILDSGEKVIIFSKFERMQKIIGDRLLETYEDIEIAKANGRIKGEDRYDQVYTQFKDNPNCKVLLLSNACAEGINAGHCKYLIEYDLAESFAIQTQRHGRIRRADSTHDKLFVYQILARESWDEVALRIINKKEGFDAMLN